MYVQVFQQYSKAVCMNLVSQGLFCLWCEVNLWAADHLPLFKKLHLTGNSHFNLLSSIYSDTEDTTHSPFYLHAYSRPNFIFNETWFQSSTKTQTII